MFCALSVTLWLITSTQDTPSEPPRKRCRTPSDRAAEPEKEVLEPEHEQVACQAIAMSPVTRIAGDSDPKNSDSPASSVSTHRNHPQLTCTNSYRADLVPSLDC